MRHKLEMELQRLLKHVGCRAEAQLLLFQVALWLSWELASVCRLMLAAISATPHPRSMSTYIHLKILGDVLFELSQS